MPVLPGIGTGRVTDRGEDPEAGGQADAPHQAHPVELLAKLAR